MITRKDDLTLTLNQNNMAEEVQSRRTFAIISHPDAGKTTLTETLLLLGGAIRLAGSIKARKTNKYATSDWMEMERKRGISVTSSVLQFPYKGWHVNLLDTPGHQDFSEDTYRTLTAADSALMLIDMGKGIEAQTIKLFEVCRMQGIPIFTFINKLDRQGKEPLDLLDEIEKVLGIKTCPQNWPINLGYQSYGLYNRRTQQLEIHEQGGKVKKINQRDILDDAVAKEIQEEIGLLDVAGDPFDTNEIKQGLQTPVYFGSAINGFGVEPFFQDFLHLAPSPVKRNSSIGRIDPRSKSFSGFVFKIQANMNPAHRDRIAFLRICSGKFQRDMVVNHVRTGKQVKLSQPKQFLSQNRDIVEDAYPGDIIGIFDPGIYQIGDTLTEGEPFQFEKLPHFTPELFAKVTAEHAMKHKQFHKGLSQLAEEGAIQIYRDPSTEEMILGVVGELQFEVFQYRLKQEYGVDVSLHRLPYKLARWIKEPDPNFATKSREFVVTDKNGDQVILFENEFSLNWFKERYSSLTLYRLEDLNV